MPRSIYRRLTGKRRRFHFFTQLWLGPDHLLLVRSNRFEETYQRFFFKDVQALIVTGFPSRTWMQASLGVLAAAICYVALTLISNPGLRVLVGLTGLLPASIAAVDFFSGPRCQMMLKTAASNEPLPPVSRMGTARLVLSRLKPAIEQVQQGEWNAAMQPVSGPQVMAPAPVRRPPANRLLLAVFGLTTINALIYAAARVLHRNEVLLLLFSTVFTEILLALAALHRRGDDQRWILYALTGVIAACATLDYVGGVSLFGFFGWIASESQRTRNPLDLPKFFLLPYPQLVMWWGLAWRVVVAVAAWVGFFWSASQMKTIERFTPPGSAPVEEVAPALSEPPIDEPGGPPSPQ